MRSPHADRAAWLACCLVAAVSCPALAVGQAPTQARLTIDGDVYNVPLGKAFAIRIGGERLTLRIDPQNDQSFDEAGVSFQHPTSLKVAEAEGGPDVRVWTLQGLSAAVMLQQYSNDLDPQSLLEVLVGNLVERDGDADIEQQPVKLTGADRAYQGVQLRAKAAATETSPATESVQNVFTFANEQGVFALLVQDVRSPGAEDSQEYTEALRLLGESLKTGKEPRPRQSAK